MKTLIEQIASTVQAMSNCIAVKNKVWEDLHRDKLDNLKEQLPSGSGIDSGCEIDLNNTTNEKVIIKTSFHHMDEHGGYDGWTEHKITIRPQFNGIDIKISGKDKNGVKEYLAELFNEVLTNEIQEA
tara:strand:- start:10615 stop:10995 length:381 start_codon:yes stop_codon:yes gene_type:complete